MYDDCHCHFTRLCTLRRAHTHKTWNLCVRTLSLSCCCFCVCQKRPESFSVLWIIWSKNNTDYSLCCYFLLLFDVVVVASVLIFFRRILCSHCDFEICVSVESYVIVLPVASCFQAPDGKQNRVAFTLAICCVCLKWSDRHLGINFVDLLSLTDKHHSQSTCSEQKSSSRRNIIFINKDTTRK